MAKSKTRKRRTKKINWKLAFLGFFCCYVITASIFTVWSRTQAVYLDYELSELEAQVKKLEKRNRALKIEKESLENPIRIEKIAEKWGLKTN